MEALVLLPIRTLGLEAVESAGRVIDALAVPSDEAAIHIPVVRRGADTFGHFRGPCSGLQREPRVARIQSHLTDFPTRGSLSSPVGLVRDPTPFPDRPRPHGSFRWALPQQQAVFQDCRSKLAGGGIFLSSLTSRSPSPRPQRLYPLGRRSLEGYWVHGVEQPH